MFNIFFENTSYFLNKYLIVILSKIVNKKPPAICNDSHLPHDGFVSKWVFKAKSGLSHAYSFTFKLDDLP